MADPVPVRLDALRSLVDAAGAALVVGPVGSGRTHLLEQFAESELDAGRPVWWCRGHRHAPASGDGPFAAGTDAGATPADLGDLAGTVLVDDAHHLSDRLLGMLTSLAERRAGDTRLVVTRRDHHPSPGLAALEAALVGPHGAVRLGPLEPPEVAELTERIGASAEAPDVDSLLTSTGGWADLVAAGLHGDGALDDLVGSRVGLLGEDHLACMVALAFGVPVGSPAFEPFTGADLATADQAVAAGHAVGLLHADPEPVPAVAAVLRRSAPRALQARLAGVAHETRAPELPVVARHLCDAGHRSAEATGLYVAAAEQVATTDPRQARALFDLAIAGGADALVLAEPRAWAALAAGEPAAALAHLAEGADRDDATEPAAAPEAAGAAWARLGLPVLAADAYQRGHLPYLAAAARAAAGIVATDARDAVATNEAAVPVDGTAELAAGMRAWVTGDHQQGFTLLERSAALAGTHHRSHRWPDTPHGALAAALLHVHDPDAVRRAEATLAEARLGGIGGTTAAARHTLLGAWCALLAGRTDDAEQTLREVRAPAGRDALAAAALHAALALRSDDPSDLDPAWSVVDQAWPRAEVDAFGVLLATEVAALAVRTGHDPEAVLAPVTDLVERLGSPVTLALPLAWGRLAVAVTADDADATQAAADALTSVAEVDERASATVLAEAGATFAAVLAGDVDPGVVHATADRLAERGMLAEATRLLGAAGLRSRDAAATKALLARLRQLQAARVRTERGTTRVEVDLSEREQEVARAVLDGLTHKEIGALLFISAKTVEHHVARIRQKLGATNRADLLAQIRQALDPAEDVPGR